MLKACVSSGWCLHICGRWACGCVQVGCPHTHTHTHSHTCTPGYPDTYRHTPAPSYRHTPMCRCVLTPVCRLPVFLSVFLCWGCWGLDSRNETFGAALEDRGCLLHLCRDPFSAGFWHPRNQGFPDQLGAAFQGASKARFREDCVTECSEMELRHDSGAQSENKSDVLPQEEMDIMKTGCCGGDLSRRACVSLLGAGALGGIGARTEFQGTGSPFVAMAGKLRVAGMARPNLINFRPFPSTTISALNLF